MTSDILDAIDSAVQDWETSRDAMRCRPGGFGEPIPAGIADYQEAIWRIATEISRTLPDGWRVTWVDDLRDAQTYTAAPRRYP